MHRGYLGAPGIESEDAKMSQIARETSSEWNILGSRWSSDPQHVERTEGVRRLEAPRGEDPAPSFGPSGLRHPAGVQRRWSLNREPRAAALRALPGATMQHAFSVRSGTERAAQLNSGAETWPPRSWPQRSEAFFERTGRRFRTDRFSAHRRVALVTALFPHTESNVPTQQNSCGGKTR
jgi:hypothetical protein